MSDQPASRASTPDDDWHRVALDKLTRVLGARTGPATMHEVLLAIGSSHLRTPADLRRFAQALIARGGFAGAVGGLLSVHATMYGSRSLAVGVREP
jgi:hypothetical protein